MNIGEVIRDTGAGLLAIVTDELRMYSRRFDVAKLRTGAPGDKASAHSFNKIWLDANNMPYREEELGLIQIKQDERTRNDVNGTRAELTIHLNNGNQAVTEDQRMVPVLLIRTDGWTMLVPNVTNPEHPPDNQQGGTPAGNYDGAQFMGSEGKFLYVRQTDGHDVLYARKADGSIVPIWVSDGGGHGVWIG